MDDLDHLLREAGARWRAAQPPPPTIDDVSWTNGGRPSNFVWRLVGAAIVGAGAVVTVVLVTGLWTQVVRGPQVGTSGPVASATTRPANVTEACDFTRPNPPFAAPAPYPSSPPGDRYAWFGTPQLWTRLELDGEVWKRSEGLRVKIFWWSSDWQPREEPEPAITVVATRLDGPGTFRVGPGTNATADDLGGTAMLVGVEFPSAGCWQLTAQHRDAVLSHVVWIKDE